MRLTRHRRGGSSGARRVHLDLADEKVSNLDGSPRIGNQLDRQSLTPDYFGLDFNLLGENL